MPAFRPWHLAIMFAGVLVVGFVAQRQAHRPRPDANASSLQDPKAIEFAAKRTELLARAKEAFVDGRTWAVVSMIGPYEKVADAEVLGIYKLAQQQEAAKAKTADADEAAEEKARLSQCRLRLDCWAKENAFNAWTACAEVIISAHEDEYFTWAIPNDGQKHRRFEAFERGASSVTSVTWSGKNARVQTSSGEFEMVEYNCQYEADVNAEGGRVLSTFVRRTGIPWTR